MKKEATTPLWARALNGGARLALVAAIGAGGWSLAQTYRSLFASPPPPTPAAEQQEPFVPDLGQGSWSCAEGDLSVRLRQCRPDEVEDLLQSLGDTVAGRGAVSALEQGLLDWLRASGARPELVKGYRVYRLPLQEAVARVVTEGQGGGERARLGQLAWPREDGLWTVLELRPVPGAAASRPGVANLLPLPAEAKPLARRWDASGRLSGELVGGVPPLEELCERWRRGGWDIRRGDGPGGAGAFCRKGDDRAYAWGFPGPTPQAGDFLIVVARPAGK